MRRPTLAVAMIVQNEARALAALLPALRWADQVVIVDGGSRDGTADVIRAHGAQYLHRPFDNFASQRNYALEACTADWVLSLDADEHPSYRLPDELARLAAAARHTGYRVPIRSRIFGRQFRFGGTQDDRPVRFVRRSAACWQGSVHEVFRVTGSVGRTRAWLKHDTLPSVNAFIAKMDRYTSLGARHLLAHNARRKSGTFAAGREIFRRLIWKHGWLDGPRGWLFCLLSGLSELELARKHRELCAAGACIPPHNLCPITHQPSRDRQKLATVAAGV